MMNHNRKGKRPGAIRCPYCGSRAVLRSADGIYRDNSRNVRLYVCANYPECDAYVRVHEGTVIPVGSLANRELRSLRKTAHRYFDRLYLSGMMSKDAAYAWLAGVLQAPKSQAHIGHLSEYYCRQVIEESQKLLDAWGRNRKHPYLIYEGGEQRHDGGLSRTG